MVEQVTSDPMVPKILSPEWAAVLVVDVQNDFCHDQGHFGRMGFDMGHIQASVRALAGFLEEARRAGVPVLFVKTHHGPWTNSEAWLTRGPRRAGELCVAETWGADFYQVAPRSEEPVIVKHRYSAFVGTDLEVILRARERRSVLVTGVATNVCVESTARDAFMRDFHMVFVENCAGATSKAEHDATLHNMRTYFGRVMDSHTVAAYWQRP